MNKPIPIMLTPEMSKQSGQGRSTQTKPSTVAKFRRATGGAKILQFAPSPTAESSRGWRERQSWGERAGLTDAERMLALAGGALIVAGGWAGHCLLAWMHIL